MLKKNTLMLAAAVAGLGMASAASAATITIGLTLTDTTSGLPLPTVGGVYQATVGENITLTFTETVNSPNVTNATRGTGAATNTRNKSLGIQTINTIVNSSGTAAMISADDAGGGTWNYTDNTTFGYPSVSLFTSNGTQMPTGVGFANTSFSLTSTAVLPNFQIGVAPTAIGSGTFTVLTPGTSTISTTTNSAVVYAENTSGGTTTTVRGVSALAGLTEGSVQIHVASTGPTTALENLNGSTLGSASSTHPTLTGGGGFYGTNVVAPSNNTTGNVALNFPDNPSKVYVMLWISGDTGNVIPTDFAADLASANDIAKLTPAYKPQGPAGDEFVVLAFNTTTAANTFNYDFSGRNGIHLDDIAAVPEPASLGLLALAGLGILSRRRK